MKLLRTVLSALAISAFGALPAAVSAQVTYTYTGNPFTEVTGAPYTTADFISGSFTVSSVLADGSSTFIRGEPSFSFLFSDGVYTHDSASTAISGLVQVFVDGGAITQWNIHFEDFILGLGISDASTCANMCGGLNLDFGQEFLASSGINSGRNFNNPGTWSGPIAAVPEPETYATMLAGLGLLGLASRRRKQKAA